MIRDFYHQIKERIRSLEKKYDLSLMMDAIDQEKIDVLLGQEKYSANSLFDAMEDYFVALIKTSWFEKNLGDSSEEILDKKVFLEYALDYVRYLSFPGSVELIQNPMRILLAEIFLEAFQVLTDFEMQSHGKEFYNRYPMEFLTKEEESQLPEGHEYFTFKKYYREHFVFEMLKLSQDVKGYTTLDHISGVCYIALYIARQLKSCNLPIDLGLVITASMGHDLGKYGAKKSEERRIPYLHYYYTDLWFEQRGMPFSGKVAANHSTWDLELENLQIESLVLIYADFRVKAKGKQMHIYDLESSFQVILDKLDNVDDAKEKRYKRVYAKLKDFEDYMHSLGVDTTLQNAVDELLFVEQKETAFMYGQEVVQNLKFQSICYNINILKYFSSLERFNELLVKLSSEKDWREIRNYIELFHEYDKYIGKNQKLLILNELQDMLLSKHEDIRNRAAEIIGSIIANFDEEYRKEIPEYVPLMKEEQTSVDLFERFLCYFLYKNPHQTQKNIEWLRINAKNMVHSLFETTQKPTAYHAVIAKHLRRAILENNDEIALALTQVLKHIKVEKIEDKEAIHEFLLFFYNNSNIEVQLAVTKLVYIHSKYAIKQESDVEFAKNIIAITSKSDDAIVNYLRMKLMRALSEFYFLDTSSKMEELCCERITEQELVKIHLKNLKSATGWIEKKANIDVMVAEVLSENTDNALQTALHFCNLLKVSSTESVRNHSGKSILKILLNLKKQERNDVAIELIRALEMQDIQFTKYIPKYIGGIIIHSEVAELDEILDDFYEKSKVSSPQLVWLVLLSVGYAVEEYLIANREQAMDDTTKRLFQKMLGILLIGLHSFDQSIFNESLKILARLFASEKITLAEKYLIYKAIDKKLLDLVALRRDDENLYIKCSASLNKIYRFISDYEFFEGLLLSQSNEKVAFFPGSFDPFSLGHKEIAKEIRNLGFDVFLSIDEFSWSKQTQPNQIRKKIIQCSIADEQNIYVFPNKYPINIANDEDIIRLRQLFDGKELALVVGSDVVKNASSYQRNGEILKLDHVIFRRKSDKADEFASDDLPEEKINGIQGEVQILNLKPQYEFISSTQIREAVDENRDFSELIDLQAQKYIYRYGLYKKAPRYKYLAPKSEIYTEILDLVPLETVRQIAEEASIAPEKIELLLQDFENKNVKMVVTRDEKNHRLIAFATGYWMRSQEYFNVIGDSKICDYLREYAVGRIFVIQSFWTSEEQVNPNLGQIVLTEFIARAIESDYTYCIFRNLLADVDEKTLRLLNRQGFVELHHQDASTRLFGVNISNPIVLNLDLRSIVKEPFRNNPRIKNTIYQMRERLQLALTKLYPGELVLSFDRKTTYSKLVKKVCELNHVPRLPQVPRVLGEKICVSYGTILNGTIVPNTVTKSLHTEKAFKPDLKSFEIEHYPNYMDLSIQIDTIDSFNRPIILIDDILHKGYRLEKMWPMFSEKGIHIDKIVVAILSGRGQEIVQKYGREAEYVYYLHSLRNWFNENAMYPFVGGDYVKRTPPKDSFLLPSLNYILPYAYPNFIRGASKEDIYNLSEVCVENALLFFEAVEQEYQDLYERSFSLYQLREIFEKTRMPDYGKSIELDLNAKPSDYLKNDLEKLRRLKSMF